MSGPFFFAWVDPNETTFGVEHHVEDENVFTFSIDHSEGNIPTLSIDIKNPKIGLLSAGRKIWAWLSWDTGSGVEPLFFGRLVGIPTNILAEACTLSFVARPFDFVDQKQALAETLKVRPFYDPVWIDASHRDDPDTILEGYSALWHVDRVTGDLTISDIITGEDGLEVFTEADAFYDSVSITLNQTPLVAIKVSASITWTQAYTGVIDFGPRTFMTYTGDGILSDWPKPDDSLSAGWSVASSSVSDDWGTASAQTYSASGSWTNTQKEHHNGDIMSSNFSSSGPSTGTPVLEVILTDHFNSGLMDEFVDPPINWPLTYSSTFTDVLLWQISTTLALRYEAARQRVEHIVFTLTADMQSILTLPESPQTGDTELLTISGGDVGIPLVKFGSAPIGTVSRRSYFPTDRGLWSIEYLIALARAHMLLRSRAVQVSFDCRFERVIALSCRKNAQLFDHRLPGGNALGKIIAYSIKATGDTGELIGNVTIACAIGYGNSIEAVEGTPTYVENVYVDFGYQFYSDTLVVLPSSDVGYSIPVDIADDDGLVFPLSKRQAVVHELVHGSMDEQMEAIGASFVSDVLLANSDASAVFSDPQMQAENVKRIALASKSSSNEAMKNNPIWYDLELRPVTNGPFEVQYGLSVSLLAIPKQIDLEAHST